MMLAKFNLIKILKYLKNNYRYIKKIFLIICFYIELVLEIIFKFIKIKNNKKNSNYNYIGGDFFMTLANNSRIYYSETHYVETAFKTNSSYNILLTHNSDRGVTEELFKKFLKL